MDISASMGMVENPSDPEEPATSASDNSVDRSSFETDPGNGLEITCDLVEKFNQGIGPWLFEVLTCAFRYGEEGVASVQSYLIKREGIQVRDNKKKSLRKAMKDEGNMLDVIFHMPKILHPHGHANPEFLRSLGYCFVANDMRTFIDTGDATSHPLNRAWILLIRDISVEAEYRRLGIGGNMIRKTIQRVMEHCVAAGRPLFVTVQPKRIDEFSDEEWANISELIYTNRVNQTFWENIGFQRLGSNFTGFAAPWYFWGSAVSLPPKKRIIIPEDLESRNTRTATPPPRDYPPHPYGQSTPYDFFPVVEDGIVKSFLEPGTRELPPLPQPPPEDDLVRGHDAADGVRWLDNPDDPSMSQDDAQNIKLLMRTLDAVGKKYRVRPLREPVQAPTTQSPSRQPKCPFKAPSGAKAPQSLGLSHVLLPNLSPATSHNAAALERNPPLAARRSVRNQVSSAQPGSSFMVTNDDDDEDNFSDMDDLDMDELEECSYEELVSLGLINPDGPSSDEEL